MLRIKNIKIFDLCAYIVCLLSIYVSGTAIVTIVEKQAIYQLLMLIMFISSFLFIIKVRDINLFLKKYTYYLLIGGFVFVVNFLNYPDSANVLILRVLYFLAFICFVKALSDRGKEIGIFLYNCIIFISIIALANYILIHILEISVPFSVVYNSNGIRYNMYSYFYLENPTSSLVYNFRLSGFFWEPGVFQIYLNYALYRFLYCNERKNKLHFIVITCCIALSYSTTGYIVAAVLIAIKLWKDSRLSKKSKFFLSIPIAVVIVAVISIILTEKKYGLDADSYNARFDDLFTGLKLFFNHLFIGAGFNNTSVFTEATGRNRGNSNGFMQIIYTMGMLGILVYVYPFIANIRKIIQSKEKLSQIIYSILLLVLNMSEPLCFYPFMLLLLSEQYCKLSFERLRKEIKNNG